MVGVEKFDARIENLVRSEVGVELSELTVILIDLLTPSLKSFLVGRGFFGGGELIS